MRRRGPLRGRSGYTRIILLMYSRLAAIDPYLQATEASPINRDSSSPACKNAQTQSAASKLLDPCICHDKKKSNLLLPKKGQKRRQFKIKHSKFKITKKGPVNHRDQRG